MEHYEARAAAAGKLASYGLDAAGEAVPRPASLCPCGERPCEGGRRRDLRSVPRQTWAHRLIPNRGGGITQAEARAAGVAHLPADAWMLVGDDRLDAAGCLLWALLPAVARPLGMRRRGRDRRKDPSKPRRMAGVRLPTPRELAKQARIAVGCACGENRHRAACPLATRTEGPRKPHRRYVIDRSARDAAWAAAAARYVPLTR